MESVYNTHHGFEGQFHQKSAHYTWVNTVFFIIARRRQNLSDARLKTCAVDFVFHIRVFRGACECTWKYWSISSNSPARHDKWMPLIARGSIHEGHEWFSDDSRGRRDFYVFGCSIVYNFANSRMKVPRYRSSLTSWDLFFSQCIEQQSSVSQNYFHSD